MLTFLILRHACCTSAFQVIGLYSQS